MCNEVFTKLHYTLHEKIDSRKSEIAADDAYPQDCAVDIQGKRITAHLL